MCMCVNVAMYINSIQFTELFKSGFVATNEAKTLRRTLNIFFFLKSSNEAKTLRRSLNIFFFLKSSLPKL